ncbi:AAA family ATPase [Nocardiopsis sp. RSe5-2]|uniref:AAA family ATPase n=1 Tax=Nocardiopsis endophytica TaxID=3018445 RepID=A0ABT4UBA2_9ACTN|nr:helix-turn-helix transcriptional regulator [Nocardiopsis endophytica]MDA2814255.1 AAA family ATPase [Nocardiopsis endophytica]
MSVSDPIMDVMSSLGMSPRDTAPVFVGRSGDVDRLLAHARRTREGRAGTILIGGEAGVGKSRLLAEFGARLGGGAYGRADGRTNGRPDTGVRAGAPVPGRLVVGGCFELGVDGLPFAPFVAVLRQLYRDLGPALAEAAGGGGELPRLLPELGPAPDERRNARGLLFQQILLALVHAAGDEGLTVVLEDLHWADASTRDLLVFLVRSLDTAPVQLVATFRTDELHRDHPLRRLLPELERLLEVERIDLSPLTSEESARLAAALRGSELSPAEAAALHARSQGNPLFVESLAEQPGFMDSPVPDRPRELLLSALRRLDDPAADVVRTAAVGAVSGGQVEHELIARVSGLPHGDLDTALRSAVDANILRVTDTGYRFRHALLREAVHDDLLPGRHTRLHLAYAEALDAVPDVVPSYRLAAEQAHHYRAAHDLPRSLSAAWWAAVYAGEKLAYPEEQRMLERVLELWDRVPDAADRTEGADRVDVLGRAAASAMESGDPMRAIELCDEGLAELPEEGGAEVMGRRALLLRRRAQARLDCADGRGMDDLLSALEIYPLDAPGYSMALSLLARGCMRRPDLDPSEISALRHLVGAQEGRVTRLDLAQGALDRAVAEGDRCAEADALVTVGSALFNTDDFVGGRKAMEEGAALARELGEPAIETTALAILAHYLREFGLHGEAVELLLQSIDRVRGMGLMSVSTPFAASNLAETYVETGDLDEAERWVAEGLSLSPSPKLRVFLESEAMQSAIAKGDMERARAAAGRVPPIGPQPQKQLHIVQLAIAAQVELLRREGDIRKAAETAVDVLQSAELEAGPGYGWQLLDLFAALLQASAASGEWPDPLPELYERVVEATGRVPLRGPVLQARQATVAARLAGVDGRPAEEVADLWAEAVERWKPLPMRPALADALVNFAEQAVAAGGERRGRAAEALREAVELADACGLRPVRHRAEDLARRAGVALAEGAGTAPPPLPKGLTRREAEVLRLLGRGMSNAGIAEELFITPKTASVHVSNILNKLDVPNRATAGARAREMGMA